MSPPLLDVGFEQREMMTKNELEEILRWFASYTASFQPEGASMPSNLEIKIAHSKRVEDLAAEIAFDLGWSEEEVILSRAVGILHDLGRFSQYADYGTFHDAVSVDHGERGWDVLIRCGILNTISETARCCILDSVRFHNKKMLAVCVPEDSLRFLKLVRDADKLDIFALTQIAAREDPTRLAKLWNGLSLAQSYNPQFVQDIKSERLCSVRDVKTLLDLRLLQISWVFDIYYTPTLERLAKSGAVADAFNRLGQSDEIAQAKAVVENRLKSCSTEALRQAEPHNG